VFGDEEALKPTKTAFFLLAERRKTNLIAILLLLAF